MTDETTNKKAAKSNAAIMRGLCKVGTKAAGEALQRDPSFISRLKSGESKLTLAEFCELLEAINLAATEQHDDTVTIKRSVYNSLTEMATIGVEQLRGIDQL